MPEERNGSAKRFSAEIVHILEQGRWYEGRTLPFSLPHELQSELFPAAERILREFGGLHVGRAGSGIDMARSDIEFDPYAAAHLVPELREHGLKLQQRLFPLAQFCNAHFYVIIDGRGRIYMLNDELLRLAPSFDQALEFLLLGKKLTETQLDEIWESSDEKGKRQG